ncbi:LCP family protein [Caldibacillus lycopersici]|uniref:LCP family protein n=1 Tax=Perspicuibacillus lycopersici TaxID=1325689 RepID=A0AAE3IR11_9BACI|nr:LCP family protein [Perspicuibacillus lycopersici]MCU9612995.1 LCP family protein [Perspicuibacillus lycopersici]
MEINSRAQKRKKRKKRKKWVWFLTPIALLLAVALVFGFHLTSKIADMTNAAFKQLDRGDSSAKRVNAVYPGKDNFSVLFIGVDERKGQTKSRSDVLVLATFNKNDDSIKLVSIPRDSYVNIPDHGQDKITHAHYFGGVDLAVSTVEELFDVPVDFYVKLNFDAFIDVVDALGGVTVDVPFTFSEMDSNDTKNAITLEEGTQTLSGEEALAFVRMRKQDPLGDIGRGERQKQVITAIVKKSASLSSITKYDDVLDGIGENMTTNLTFQNIVALHPYAKSISAIDSYALEGDNSRINGIYYYQLREESVNEISQMLKEHLEID